MTIIFKNRTNVAVGIGNFFITGMLLAKRNKYSYWTNQMVVMHPGFYRDVFFAFTKLEEIIPATSILLSFSG